MKLIASFIAIALSVSTFSLEPLQLETDYLHCYDGEVELSFFPENGYVLDYDSSPIELLSKKNTMKIRKGSKVYTYSQNVIIMADGAGNDAVQVLVVDDFGPLTPVVEFTFEHEGAYLSGYYSLPKEGVDLENDRLYPSKFGEKVNFKEMYCNVGLEDHFGINLGF
jgi:hypothetical protein